MMKECGRYNHKTFVPPACSSLLLLLVLRTYPSLFPASTSRKPRSSLTPRSAISSHWTKHQRTCWKVWGWQKRECDKTLQHGQGGGHDPDGSGIASTAPGEGFSFAGAFCWGFVHPITTVPYVLDFRGPRECRRAGCVVLSPPMTVVVINGS